MAGDWVPWLIGLTRKREVLAIAEKTDRSRFEVGGLLAEFWGWLSEESRDGHVPSVTPKSLCGAVGADESFWIAVQDVGWLRADVDGISIPHPERWNDKSAKARMLSSLRKKRQREKGKNGHDNVTPESRPERDASVTDERYTPTPTPTSSPPTPPSEEGGDRGGEVASPPDERKTTTDGAPPPAPVPTPGTVPVQQPPGAGEPPAAPQGPGEIQATLPAGKREKPSSTLETNGKQKSNGEAAKALPDQIEKLWAEAERLLPQHDRGVRNPRAVVIAAQKRGDDPLRAFPWLGKALHGPPPEWRCEDCGKTLGECAGRMNGAKLCVRCESKREREDARR